MGKYIDKDRVAAEIERHLKYANNCILYAQNMVEKGLNEYEVDLNAWEHCQSMCKNILSFLNTLEVKEVDLKNEIANLYESNYEDYLTYEEFAYIAKYFFELGHN